MIEVTAEDSHPLRPFDEAVHQAYEDARASGWHPRTRVPLREAAVAAVLAYATHPEAAEAARRYYLLLVDLAADAIASEIAAWPAESQRALRVAATRTLASPGKPHHRPRAQALLKRLDTLANPALQAREQVLLALSRQRQAVRELQLQTSGRGPSDDRRPAHLTLQGRAALLARLTDVVRGLPRTRLAPEEVARFLEQMRGIEALAATEAVFEPGRQAELFERLQRAMAPGREDLPLASAVAALDAVRALAHPGVAAARQQLLEMVFELELAEVAPAARPELERHLADLTHVATHLMEIPSASLPALLFRLHQRLGDPGNGAIEPLIDAALATLERLDAERNAVAARVRALDGAQDEERRARLDAARTRQRQLDGLASAMHGLRLGGLTSADTPGVLALFRDVDDLATDADLDPRTFEQTLKAIATQLERPRLTRDRVWQAANTALNQLIAQRQQLEETIRALGFDRHLSAGKRMAREHLLARQLEALDHARMVFGSLPLEGLAPEREAEALAAITGFNLAVRQVVAGHDTTPLRQAIERVVASVEGWRS